MADVATRKRQTVDRFKQTQDSTCETKRRCFSIRGHAISSLDDDILSSVETKDVVCNDFKRMDSGYSSLEVEDDEADLFTAVNVDVDCTDSAPIEVTGNSRWTPHLDNSPVPSSSMKKRSFLRRLFSNKDTFDHPDDSSSIRIMHEHADYPTIGDEFGMTLKTFENKDFKDGQHYFRHFLTEIAANSPASKLHIHELDELVLLNKDFVPNKTHKNVVDLFKHIPVDSKTELTMVIRRENQKDIFTWISISAILVPVYDHEPKVIKVKVHDLGEEYKDQRWLLLKVQGQPLYMTPGNDTALCTHLKNDQSDRNKEVLITTQMDTVGRRILFKSSIQFKNNKYLVMDEQGGQPLLKSTQFWYGYNTSGSWASFKSQDERYIGYSNLDNQLTLVDGDYKFETFPPQGTFDHTDAPNGSDVTTREYAECMETRNMKTPLRNKISNNDSGMSSLCDSDLELDLESSYGSFTESLIENGGSTAQNSSMDSLSGSSLPARIHPMVTRQMSASTEMCKLSLT